MTLESKSTLWCWKCSLLLRPEKLMSDIHAWLRSHDLHDLMISEDATVGMTGYILGIMLRDEMDELTFLPSDEDYRMVVKRDGQHFEFEPPSPEMHREIGVAVRAMWHGNPRDCEPFDAVQTIHYDELHAAVQLTIAPTPAGEVLRFQFSYPDENSAETPIPQPAAMV